MKWLITPDSNRGLSAKLKKFSLGICLALLAGDNFKASLPFA